MANEQNLTHQLTAEERSKGGTESGKTRRLKSAFEKRLDAKVTSGDFNEIMEEFGIEKGSAVYMDAVACVGVRKAAQGDLAWATFIRDLIGEKPKDEIALNGGVVIIDDVPAAD